MGTAVRQGSETVYYLDPAQVKMQEAAGGAKCVPVPGYSGRSRKSVYRMAPSSLLPGRLLQPVSGMTFPGGLQCDTCPQQRLLRQLSSEDASYDGAATSNEPQILRLVPQGRNVYLEEVKPLPRVRSSRSARQRLPDVMQVVEDNDYYDKLVPAETSESDVPLEPDTCHDCMEELMHRRRAPESEPDVATSPVYVTKVPSSRRSSSRRLSSLPMRTLSRGLSASSPSPRRCSRCAACKSCGTAQSDSTPTTTRSRSRKWYE